MRRVRLGLVLAAAAPLLVHCGNSNNGGTDGSVSADGAVTNPLDARVATDGAPDVRVAGDEAAVADVVRDAGTGAEAALTDAGTTPDGTTPADGGARDTGTATDTGVRDTGTATDTGVRDAATLTDGATTADSGTVRDGGTTDAASDSAADAARDSGPEASTCVDNDHDGFGVGATCVMVDCNDANANVHPGATEVCNGIDDDCDGMTDELLGSTTCGVGACAHTVPSCLNGATNACTPLGQSIETCNGIDDDCNGVTDDGIPAIACGRGACANTAVACVNGVTQTCTPRTAGSETCNGMDDNCDGATDENLTQACYTGPAGTSGRGACHGGAQTCTGGTYGGECAGQVTPVAETCNFIDDNCNGSTDEGIAPVACYTGPNGTQNVGACHGGTQSCTAAGLGRCTNQVVPVAETCNGVDDDCNGLTDDGVPSGATCSTGMSGVCAAGTTSCSGGTVVCTRTMAPGTETCDGLDNNCNGSTDEGNPGGGGACATGMSGVCATGTLTCAGGSLSCVRTVNPSNEVCDSLDNNCDGATDNGNPGGGFACNTGLIGACAAGTTACSSGTIVCSHTTTASPETCDGVDNNCNGTTDEGNPGGGASCATGMSGACAAGTTSCTGGALACNRTTAPSVEVCDAVDNNCNGTTDEGLTRACYSGAAGTSGVGRCHAGAQTCNTGSWGSTCPGEVTQAATETCGNGIDDNCNGTADEGCGVTNDLCSTATDETLTSASSTFTVSGTTTGATNDYDCSCGFASTACTAPDRAYDLVLDGGPATYTFTDTLDNGTVGYDTVLTVHTSVACGLQDEIACNDDISMDNVRSSVTLSNPPRGIYYVVQDGYRSNSGAYVLTGTRTAIVNDQCPGTGTSTAAVISANGAYTGTTTGQTADFSPTSCGIGSTNAADVVYSITARTTGTITLDTIGSAYDTVLYVKTSCGAATDVACNDDGGGTFTSALTFNAVAGTTYYVYVDGYGSSPVRPDSGAYVLNVSGY